MRSLIIHDLSDLKEEFKLPFSVKPCSLPMMNIEDNECHIRPDLTVEIVREACVAARNARVERFEELQK